MAGSLLGLCANVVCLLSVLLQPYMPSVSEEIQAQLKVLLYHNKYSHMYTLVSSWC